MPADVYKLNVSLVPFFIFYSCNLVQFKLTSIEINCRNFSKSHIWTVIKYRKYSDWYPHPRKELERVYKSESRIVVLNCGASAAGQVLRQAEKFGLTRDGYAWIVSDGVTGNFVSLRVVGCLFESPVICFLHANDLHSIGLNFDAISRFAWWFLISFLIIFSSKISSRLT